MSLNILDDKRDGKKSVASKTEIIKLSASAVKTYDQCPRKYYYTYIDKAPRKQWAHFDLGNLCHKALEVFHEVYMQEGLTKKKSLAKLMGYGFKIARKDFPHMNDSQLAEAKSLLMDYLLFIKQNGMPMVKGVETSFDFYLREDVRIRGFLDRVDILKDGRFHIVDYKTTKNIKYLDKFQLLVYGLWLIENYPEVDSFKGSYVLLRHGAKSKEYEFNTKDVEKTKKELLAYADAIRSEDTWAPVPTILCRWCDFNNICPAQQAW